MAVRLALLAVLLGGGVAAVPPERDSSCARGNGAACDNGSEWAPSEGTGLISALQLKRKVLLDMEYHASQRSARQGEHFDAADHATTTTTTLPGAEVPEPPSNILNSGSGDSSVMAELLHAGFECGQQSSNMGYFVSADACATTADLVACGE